VTDRPLRRAAIVGGGRMGLGIAESLLAAGLEVAIAEESPERCAASRAALRARVAAHVEAGLVEAVVAERAEAAPIGADVVAASEGADLVLEAVTEDLEVKRDVLGRCDAAAAEHAVVASNTSSLDIDELSTFVARPERFLGMHWFNPPEWTPGVEVVPTERTRPDVTDRVCELLRRAGKRPIVVASSVGFIANRLQMALFCEAARCVEEGLATPAGVDEVVRSCFGFRLPFFGPFQIADMAGLDVYEAVLAQHRRGLGDRFEVPEAVRALVAEGRHGPATGSGFYAYPEGERERLLLERDRRYAALGELLEAEPPLEFGEDAGPWSAPTS
jgi:3-hydroxybutyryl-CoA dehydrogenase